MPELATDYPRAKRSKQPTDDDLSNGQVLNAPLVEEAQADLQISLAALNAIAGLLDQVEEHLNSTEASLERIRKTLRRKK